MGNRQTLSNVKPFTLYGKAGSFTTAFMPRACMLKDPPLNRVEAIRILNALFDFALTQPLSIPIIKELALFSAGTAQARLETGPLKRGIHRRYLRLCRLQGELGRLDLKKAAPGVSLEDFVFSKIDFFRYREMEVNYFETLFLEGLKDFGEVFFREKFSLGKREVQSLIETNYTKTDNLYRLQRENSIILSVMRTLETSLEDLPLFTPEEISEELKKLSDFSGGSRGSLPPEVRNSDTLYPLLLLSLDNVVIVHEDGMETRLIFSAQGNLEGIFRPENKPWTRILIPNYRNVSSLPTNPVRG